MWISLLLSIVVCAFPTVFIGFSYDVHCFSNGFLLSSLLPFVHVIALILFSLLALWIRIAFPMGFVDFPVDSLSPIKKQCALSQGTLAEH